MKSKRSAPSQPRSQITIPMQANDYALAAHIVYRLGEMHIDKTRKRYYSLAWDLVRIWEQTHGHVNLKRTTQLHLYTAVMLYGQGFDLAVDPLIRKRCLYCFMKVHTMNPHLYFQVLKAMQVPLEKAYTLLPGETTPDGDAPEQDQHEKNPYRLFLKNAIASISIIKPHEGQPEEQRQLPTGQEQLPESITVHS